MARKKEWTKDKIIDAVKHLSIAKKKNLKDITVRDIRDAKLYHAVVSEFKGYKGLKKAITKEIKDPIKNYVIYMEDIYMNVLKVPSAFYDNLRAAVYGQYKDIDAAHKKRETIKKYMDMVEEYRKKYKHFPPLSQKGYQYLYRLIKSNRYVTTEMFDMIDYEDDKTGEWLKWLDKIEGKFYKKSEDE
jgi:hypothetical protein